MKNIPHDYYLRFLDPFVHDEVLSFHTKGNYIIHPATQQSANLHFLTEQQLETLTGNELKLYQDISIEIPMNPHPDIDPALIRNESETLFNETEIDFSTIEKLVTPLTRLQANESKRGYPSGGALYPVEIFICSLARDNKTWPCQEKVLHLLPKSKTYEVVLGTENVDELRTAILPESSDIGYPSLALIYMAYLPKALFKYRYRGYRLATMEVGSIYMLIELSAKSLNLRCRPWSAYTDTMVCKALKLNPALFVPMCVHYVGRQG
ncbi:microcin B17 processing protein McbC [Pseudomonas brassicacearum]|uniref:SagB/ThcOx family dehydrogenase n=1 Tax=Pseudomonas brassicacearum TaxID=930166 RepID=UPI000F478731|nr:SagB/ThcOx family dehydrogenase [Pseudomonas brassicacearum]ROM69485.1 microcin B17 processing protein McbC [Pseudomonas brassicacearum]